jgi:hypothetical protein
LDRFSLLHFGRSFGRKRSLLIGAPISDGASSQSQRSAARQHGWMSIPLSGNTDRGSLSHAAAWTAIAHLFPKR